MPAFNLPDVTPGKSIEETANNLTNLMTKYRKELDYLLENLDNQNIRTLNAEKIQTGYLKIGASNDLVDGIEVFDTNDIKRIRIGRLDDLDEFGIEIKNVEGKTVLSQDSNGDLTLDGRLLITNGSNSLFDAYKDSFGGKLAIYDINGNLNVRIGTEGTGDNVSGTLILYNDDELSRVALGIKRSNDSGILHLLNSDDDLSIILQADLTNPVIRIIDNSGAMTDITPTAIYINNQKVATENWVNNQGFATENWVNNQSFATQSWVSSQSYATQSSVQAIWSYLLGL